jgi:hypothetical protein
MKTIAAVAVVLGLATGFYLCQPAEVTPAAKCAKCGTDKCECVDCKVKCECTQCDCECCK